MESEFHDCRVRCPRCGYDLRGAVAAWDSSCALTGSCAECGLEFEWRDVFTGAIYQPKWCVEYSRTLPTLLWRSFRTLVLTFWPWGFWKSLKMSHEVRWGRLTDYIILILVGTYVAFCMAHGALAYGVWSRSFPSRFGLVATVFNWYEIVHAMLLPLSAESPAVTNSPWSGAASPRGLFNWYWRDVVDVLPAFLVMHALCSAGFIALPVSRRMAKVRWSHILRVTLYGLGMVVPVILLGLVGTALLVQNLASLQLTGRMLQGAAAVAAYSLLGVEFIWWSTATGRYLKIRHPWGVGAAVVVMSVLVTGVGAALRSILTGQ